MKAEDYIRSEWTGWLNEGPSIRYRVVGELKYDVRDYNELVEAVCDLRKQVYELRKRLGEHESSI